MSIADRFYRSLYCTLGMACACLGYAELLFLPEIAVLALVVGVLLGLGYWAEGRWSLSIRAANLLGGVIALAAIGYVAIQFFRPFGATLIDTLPWPTSLLPYLGPLLMVLIPAKLFRPKHVGDIWSLFGIGLITVALGCALAGDMLFGLLLIMYLACLVWSLTLFGHYRQWLALEGEPGKTNLPARTWARTSVWTAIATAVAFAVFLATPRSTDARWEYTLRAGALQTGLNDERPSIDLNNSGVLAINRELAYEVRAFEADEITPKTDLNPNQYWRTDTFNFYEYGRWDYRFDGEQREHQLLRTTPPSDRTETPRSRPDDVIGRSLPNPSVNRVRTSAQLPNLGPGQVFLKFFPQSRSGQTPIFAEPIWRVSPGEPDSERRSSVVTVQRNWQTFWYQTADRELRPPAFLTVSSPTVYRQVFRPFGEISPGSRIRASNTYREHHTECRSVPALRDWTQNLIRSMARSGAIPTEALGEPLSPNDPVRVPPAHAEAVARAMRNYLASSGEFEYTLELRRFDERLDPVEDFVLNVKVGHCQRFASAMALMLRSVGIPSRVVLGFHGYDTDGSGVYEVRQNHAHAWAEVLVPRTIQGEQSWLWLTLDPTPQGDATADAGFALGPWIEWMRNLASTFFRYFIVEYDSDQQGRARSWFGELNWAAAMVGPDGDQWWRLPVVVAGVLGTLIWIRGRRRRSRASSRSDAAADLFTRLVRTLQRGLGLERNRGQTPAEYARLATQRLDHSSDPKLAADTVNAYYRMRFGQELLDSLELASLTQRLERLELELGRTATLALSGRA